MLACMLLVVGGGARGNAQTAEGVASLVASKWPHLASLPGIDVKALPDDMLQALVFFDPNCPVCARLWLALYGAGSSSKGLATRWIPVAYFNSRSLAKAASILTEASPVALARNFSAFDFKERRGAAPEGEITGRLRSQLRLNEAAWQALAPATPLIVYRNGEGQVLMQTGMPPRAKLDSMLASMRPARLPSFK